MAFDLGTSAGVVILDDLGIFSVVWIPSRHIEGIKKRYAHPKSLRRLRWVCHPVAWYEHPKHLRLHGLCPRKPSDASRHFRGKTGGWLPLHIAAQKGHLVIDSDGMDRVWI